MNKLNKRLEIRIDSPMRGRIVLEAKRKLWSKATVVRWCLDRGLKLLRRK